MYLFKYKRWLPWVFRGSALLQFNAMIFLLFVLAQSSRGSIKDRLEFMTEQDHWVIIAWLSSVVAIFSIVASFTALNFLLNRTYRIILQCAWFVAVVGAMIAFLDHFIQMTIIPTLLEWIVRQPSGKLVAHLGEWQWLQVRLVTLIIPSCFAISGLIYTAVMFRTSVFPRILSWWSFVVWSLLLCGVLFSQSHEYLYFFYASLILFGYIPWLWMMAGVTNKRQLIANAPST